MSEAPSTASLWQRMSGDLLGFGPVVRMMGDPAFQQSVMAMVASLNDSGRRQARIEAKLDYLMRVMGHGATVDLINETVNSALAPAPLALPATVSSPRGGAGDGGVAAASPPLDDGVAESPRAARGLRNGSAEGDFDATGYLISGG